MAGHAYVNRGYSNYTNAPQEYGYAYGPNQQVNWYMVETTTVERVRVPSSGYTNFGGGPPTNELFKEYVSRYTPRDHYEGYEVNYGPDHYEGYEVNYGPEYENSSSPRYHEQEDLMNKFLNKLQIGATQPTNFDNFSNKNKFQPKTPNKYRPKSPTRNNPPKETYLIKAQNLPGPHKYRPISPTKYRPVSPTKYRPSSPTKYRPTSPTKYRPSSPTKYRPTSPTKYRPSSPTKYRPTSPTKYRPSSPTKYRPSSPNNYHPSSPTNYRPSSPIRYRPSSPTRYRPSSPTEYHPSNPTTYETTSPPRKYFANDNHLNMVNKLPGPNKYRPTSPIRSYPLNGQPIINQTLSGPNKQQPSGPGSEGIRPVRVEDFSGPHNKSTGPPVTRQLTNPTNDINEALNVLTESVNNSPRSEPRRTEAFDKSSPRETKPIFGSVARRFFKSNTIDSQEAARRYNGAQVP